MTRWSALSLYPAWNADEVKNPHCVNSVIHLCTEMHIITCTLNLNVTKCPTKSKCKPPVCNFGVSLYSGYFSVRNRPSNVSSGIILRRTLYALYSPYFSPEVMVQVTRRMMGTLCDSY